MYKTWNEQWFPPKKIFLCIFWAKITQDELSLMANATGAWIEFLYLKVTWCYVTRWTQNSKENISNINRRNKRNTRSTIVFQECLKSPKCLIAESAGEKSQQRQKAKLFLGTTRCWSPVPRWTPCSPRCSTWCRRRWRNWPRRSFGGRFGG